MDTTRRMVLAAAGALLLAAAAGCTLDESVEERGAAEEQGAVGEELFAARVCADGPTVEGIDVSHWDGSIDWDEVSSAGITFAFMKATQGTSYVDETFATNWSEAARVGIPRGAYHFLCPEMDGTEQADHFLDTVGTIEEGDLPPVLDVEECPTSVCGTSCDWVGLGCETIVNTIGRWVDRIAEVTGRTPIIYTGWGTWDGYICDSEEFSDLPLWVANYRVTCPLLPDAWEDWAFWQYDDTGRIPGIPSAVDLDVFNGDLAALEAFIAGTTPECGDGACDAGENCASCPDDCGPCPPDDEAEETEVEETPGETPVEEEPLEPAAEETPVEPVADEAPQEPVAEPDAEAEPAADGGESDPVPDIAGPDGGGDDDGAGMLGQGLRGGCACAVSAASRAPSSGPFWAPLCLAALLLALTRRRLTR